MVLDIKEIERKVRQKDLENSDMLMEINTKGIGIKIKLMVKEFIFIQMEQSILEIEKMIHKKVLE